MQFGRQANSPVLPDYSSVIPPPCRLTYGKAFGTDNIRSPCGRSDWRIRKRGRAGFLSLAGVAVGAPGGGGGGGHGDTQAAQAGGCREVPMGSHSPLPLSLSLFLQSEASIALTSDHTPSGRSSRELE